MWCLVRVDCALGTFGIPLKVLAALVSKPLPLCPSFGLFLGVGDPDLGGLEVPVAPTTPELRWAGARRMDGRREDVLG